jgi:hypothetical protein
MNLIVYIPLGFFDDVLGLNVEDILCGEEGCLV